jgi:hypothetical protein
MQTNNTESGPVDGRVEPASVPSQENGLLTRTGSPCGGQIGRIGGRAILTVRDCATGEVIAVDQDAYYAALHAAFATPQLPAGRAAHACRV